MRLRFAFRAAARSMAKSRCSAPRTPSLAMLAASIVVEEGETVLHDVPDIEDVERALGIAARGWRPGAHHDKRYERRCGLTHRPGSTAASCPTRSPGASAVRCSSWRRLQIRLGYVELPGSGGCDIGTRKIDFHHRGFARLGADVQYFEDGRTIIELGGRRFKRRYALPRPAQPHRHRKPDAWPPSLADGRDDPGERLGRARSGRLRQLPQYRMGADIRGLGRSYAVTSTACAS